LQQACNNAYLIVSEVHVVDVMAVRLCEEKRMKNKRLALKQNVTDGENP
jgi:hypothetical protein